MRRRDLLAVTTGTLSGLAGCARTRFDRLQTKLPSSDDSTADSSNRTDQSATESTDAIVVGDADDVPFPSAHPPHELAIRNESETDRTISVAIEAAGDDGKGTVGGDDGNGEDDGLLERDLDLAAGAALEIVLVEPRSYAVTVATSAPDGTGESTASVGIDREPFDCTRSRTLVTLRETGIQTESTSTSIPCPEPTVADASFELGDRQCAGRTDDDRATVEFADEALIVDGDITTPTPCHTVSIAETAYDERRDTLAITVAVGDQDAGHCIDCIGTAAYEARIDLEGRYPGRVEVIHETRGEGQRVATAESPAA